MKLFGKTLFEKSTAIRMYDFAQHGLLRMSEGYGLDAYVEVVPVNPVERAKLDKKKRNEAKKRKEAEKTQKTPKEIFEMKTLNVPELHINFNEDYLDEQIEVLTQKLEVLGPAPKRKKNGGNTPDEYMFGENGAVKYGRQEVESMIERLNNRRRIAQFESIIDEFPATTNDAIRQLLANQPHLEAKLAYDTLPDLPKDAVEAMKTYTDMTQKLCGKKPIFYLIAEKKKREEVARKRDPILLAQSPFGFFWQILGAWDDEVKFLEEL